VAIRLLGHIDWGPGLRCHGVALPSSRSEQSRDSRSESAFVADCSDSGRGMDWPSGREGTYSVEGVTGWPFDSREPAFLAQAGAALEPTLGDRAMDEGTAFRLLNEGQPVSLIIRDSRVDGVLVTGLHLSSSTRTSIDLLLPTRIGEPDNRLHLALEEVVLAS
jgi:hypothetical protein